MFISPHVDFLQACLFGLVKAGFFTTKNYKSSAVTFSCFNFGTVVFATKHCLISFKLEVSTCLIFGPLPPKKTTNWFHWDSPCWIVHWDKIARIRKFVGPTFFLVTKKWPYGTVSSLRTWDLYLKVFHLRIWDVHLIFFRSRLSMKISKNLT